VSPATRGRLGFYHCPQQNRIGRRYPIGFFFLCSPLSPEIRIRFAVLDLFPSIVFILLNTHTRGRYPNVVHVFHVLRKNDIVEISFQIRNRDR
jgi:hypothetical protein